MYLRMQKITEVVDYMQQYSENKRENVSSHEPGEPVSPILLTPKSDGSYRMILNLYSLTNSAANLFELSVRFM